MATLGQIEQLTKEYADARGRLCKTMRDLHDTIESLKRQYLPGIKLQVSIAKEKKDCLKAAIEDSPALFEKPRTIIITGIKVGFEKGRGKIEWASDEVVVRLIKKHFPEQADILIKTTEKPLKKPLARLSVAELKRIGVTVEETGDVVYIKPVDSEVDKLVEALLEEDEKRTEEDAA